MKVCSWLDSNIWGGIQIIDRKIYPCCGPGRPLICLGSSEHYADIRIEDIQDARKDLYKNINNGTACQGCPHIVDKPAHEIRIEEISYLSIAPFNTCNLECQYCYLSSAQRQEKITSEDTTIYSIVQKWHEAKMLKQNFELGLAGGEPSLISDIDRTLDFISSNYVHCSVSFISNASISNRIKHLSEIFSSSGSNIIKTLYTSIDCGTSSSYTKIRGKDLFDVVKENILMYASKASFDVILLKYIFLFDHSNTSDEDIYGFLLFARQVQKANENETAITIDFDMLNEKKCMDDVMLRAAGKLYFIATNLLGMRIVYAGGSLVSTTEIGKKNITMMLDYAEKFSTNEHTSIEKFFLRLLADSSNDNEMSLYKEDSILSKLKNVLRFNSREYIRRHPDVTSSGMNPLYHYLRYGLKEQRRL